MRYELLGVRGAELVDESLRSLRLFHDTFAVILTDGSAELVVVHGRPVFALAPQFRHPDAVLDFEDAALAVEPAYCRAVNARLGEQLFQELPQVNVRPVGRGARLMARPVRGGRGRALLVVFHFVVNVVH